MNENEFVQEEASSKELATANEKIRKLQAELDAKNKHALNRNVQQMSELEIYQKETSYKDKLYILDSERSEIISSLNILNNEMIFRGQRSIPKKNKKKKKLIYFKKAR